MQIILLDRSVREPDRFPSFLRLYSAYEQCLPRRVPVVYNLQLKIKLPSHCIGLIVPEPSLANVGIYAPPKIITGAARAEPIAITLCSLISSSRIAPARPIARLILLPQTSPIVTLFNGEPPNLPCLPQDVQTQDQFIPTPNEGTPPGRRRRRTASAPV